MSTALDRRETVMARTGLPGHGKSWSLVKYIIEVWIPEHDGVIFTNVPLLVAVICDYFASRAPKGKREEVRERVRKRIHLIPSEVDQTWLDGTSNPREYFDALAGELRNAVGQDEPGDETAESDVDGQAAEEREREKPAVEHPLRRSLVVIDEAGKMWPAMPSKERKPQNDAVKAWIATLRHYGARVCFVCQDLAQLDAGIRRLCAVELRCTKVNTQPEPVTGALIDDWFQLLAKFTGVYLSWIREVEIYKEDRSEIEGRVTSGIMWPKYFRFYDSHNNPGEASGAEELPQYKRFGFVKFGLWLVGRNLFNWGWRAVLVGGLWALFGPPFWIGPKVAVAAVNKAMEVANGNAANLAMPGDRKPDASAGAVTVAGKSTPGGDRSQVETLMADLAAERKRAADLEQKLGVASGVVGLVGQWVLMGDGTQIHVGESYSDGPYKGRKVVSVDARNRAVRLDNGVQLRLSLGQAVHAAGDAAASTPEVARGTPTAGTAGESSQAGSPGQSNKDNRPGGEVQQARRNPSSAR